MVTRILMVHDEPAIADTLAYALKTEGFTADCVGLGREALSAIRDGDFSLVILDVGLPDLNGFDVCRELRRVSDMPVVFLTARSDEVDRIVGLELGADDYVPKPFSPREVVSRVRAILRRARPPLARVSRQPFPSSSTWHGARISYFGTWLALTRYEFRMLAALLERPGKVFSRSRLMDVVWSNAEETLERTVDAHVKTLRAKLRAVRPDDEPIETHRGLGYSIRGDLALNIAIRLFAGYFLIVGLASWFLVSIFAREVEPGVRQATEETLVDTANLLAEIAADELAAGTIAKGRFAAAVGKALEREPNALIWDVSKKSVNARVYVTDARGIVLFDSAGEAAGTDYSQWRDVARVLRGEYGARSTREDPDDPQSSSMYVAAPVLQHGKLIGVLSVSKPVAALMPYADRARDRVMRAGILLLAISAVIGVGFTLWLVWSLNRLRDYALAVAEGKRATPPVGGGRQLSVLAKSLALMREKLDGKQYVEHYVQSLTHELKSPLTAVRGAAELLQESPSAEDGQRFARNIGEQAERMQRIIERLLDLVRVEQLQNPEERRRIVLAELIDAVAQSRAERLD